jgi:hypothetical protein
VRAQFVTINRRTAGRPDPSISNHANEYASVGTPPVRCCLLSGTRVVRR